MSLYADRHQAGQTLAFSLTKYAGRDDALVLGLPRGGVPVAYEVARRLDLPLDVFVVVKLSAPGNPELAMGAVAGKGLCVLNDDIVRGLSITKDEIFTAARHQHPELVQREHSYRGDRPPVDVRGKIAILVDDGLATGASMRAAIRALRQSEPAQLVVAVPVAPAETCSQVSQEADEVVCAAMPESFQSVSLWYEDFTPTPDEEVRALLEAARQARESEPIVIPSALPS